VLAVKGIAVFGRREKDTYAALILLLLEGGCPWLWTKRICLGGGRCPLINVVMAPSSKLHGPRRGCLGTASRLARLLSKTGVGGVADRFGGGQRSGITIELRESEVLGEGMAE